MIAMPELAGVEHRYITTPDGLQIHVATAGPADGSAVMLVHGFPQHWWEWRAVIGPLADAGYRVLVPDLRGAGWSDAPASGYEKARMADDLLAVLDAFGVDRAAVVGHDWGGPPAGLLMVRHPERVSRYVGLNTIAPWLTPSLGLLRHLWALWYQFVLLAPGLGPRLIASRRGRFTRWLCRWVGGGWFWDEADAEIFLGRIREPARARAGSLWYRTFQAREVFAWLFSAPSARLTTPMLWITGTDDPVITTVFHEQYNRYAEDIRHVRVPGVGHWIVEQAPEVVTAHLLEFLAQ